LLAAALQVQTSKLQGNQYAFIPLRFIYSSHILRTAYTAMEIALPAVQNTLAK
jgi:hypothetical protein